MTVGSPTAASAPETVTAFVQSTGPEFDADAKFQLGSVSTSGAALDWTSYNAGGASRGLLFYMPNRLAAATAAVAVRR